MELFIDIVTKRIYLFNILALFSMVLDKQHDKNVKMLLIVSTRKRDFHSISCFFSFLDAIKQKFFSEDVVSVK